MAASFTGTLCSFILWIALLISVNASRAKYAMCLSGQVRTFQYTIPRYVQLLHDNEAEGLDIFLYVADETGKKVNINEIREFLNRPEVKVSKVIQASDEVTHSVADMMSHCKNTDATLRNALLQASKIMKCQELIDEYVASNRDGEEYDLIIRSRPDILLPPQSFYLNRFEAVIHKIEEGTFELKMENINQRVKKFVSGQDTSSVHFVHKFHPSDIQQASKFNDERENLNHSSSSSSSNTSTSSNKHYLFVPMCCDWEGLNDQFAIGNSAAMKAYAHRWNTWDHNYAVAVRLFPCLFFLSSLSLLPSV
jgi:hypothetical protein